MNKLIAGLILIGCVVMARNLEGFKGNISIAGSTLETTANMITDGGILSTYFPEDNYYDRFSHTGGTSNAIIIGDSMKFTFDPCSFTFELFVYNSQKNTITIRKGCTVNIIDEREIN